MLREIERTHQDSPKLLKRWFTSQEMDLFVWSDPSLVASTEIIQDKASIIVRFQMSIKHLNEEYAVYWDNVEGCKTFTIDEGSQPGKHPKSPLMLESEIQAIPTSLAEIEQAFAQIEYQIASFVLAKLKSSLN